jgi:hypothetical protein
MDRLFDNNGIVPHGAPSDMSHAGRDSGSSVSEYGRGKLGLISLKDADIPYVQPKANAGSFHQAV